MAGRKRKPDHMKLVEGTFRPDRANPDAPAPVEDSPRPPTWLPRDAVEHFGAIRARLEAINVASATDTEMLDLVALRLAEVEELTVKIQNQGRTITTGAGFTETYYADGAVKSRTERKGVRRSNPLIAQRNESMRHVHSLLAEFGLSPAARAKVIAAVRPPKTEKSFNARNRP